MVKIDDLFNKIKDKSNIESINKAYLFALEKHKGKKRLTGEDFITHPIEVAIILAELNVESDTIIAALLHETINNGNSDNVYSEIKNIFGEEMANIVDSISKINKLELNDAGESGALYLRKILVGMAEDVKVLYVKLADRLHNMRTASILDEKKTKIKAKETLDILVPIAHRLGINSIKSELENLSLKYLKPDVYNDIVEKLNATVDELQDELLSMKQNISLLLKESNINFEIKGRVKSIYSIYKKLSTGRKWDDIYDILALRIFVEKESDCYTVLGLVHSKYRSVPKRFKDFIANPKGNMYQSLHTTVFGESSKLYEIQIRTYEMDLVAEKGIAAHWSYKEKNTKKVQRVMEQKLELFRNIVESNEGDIDLTKSFESNFIDDLIYVYTPKGDVVELPKGSSPIDFAYRIHSNVGDTTVGAIVNDVIVPFTHELEDGDIINIKTSPTAKPNKDWLNIVKTTQAKNKIKSHFSKKLRDEYISKGKEIIEKEIRKRKLSISEVLSDENKELVINKLKFKEESEIYLSIGSLRYTAGYIINLITITDDEDVVSDIFFNKERRKQLEKTNYKGDIFVAGEKNILISLAKCCNPIKGNEIIGFITKTQGITVHKKECSNIDQNSERLIDVTWNYDNTFDYLATFHLTVSSDIEILPNIIELATKKNIKVQAFEIINEKTYSVTVKIKDNDQYNEFLNHVKTLKYVKEVLKK